MARDERLHRKSENVGDDGKEHQGYPDSLLSLMR